MKRVMILLDHAVMILCLMFLTFLVLDQFNPMMNFVNNRISQVLLALLCGFAIVRTVLGWTGEEI